MNIYQSIHGTSLLVMLEAWPLFTRNINEPWQLISISVKPTTVPQEYLRQKKKSWIQKDMIFKKLNFWQNVYFRSYWKDIPGSSLDGLLGYFQAKECHQPWSIPLQVFFVLLLQGHWSVPWTLHTPSVREKETPGGQVSQQKLCGVSILTMCNLILPS